MVFGAMGQIRSGFSFCVCGLMFPIRNRNGSTYLLGKLVLAPV